MIPLEISSWGSLSQEALLSSKTSYSEAVPRPISQDSGDKGIRGLSEPRFCWVALAGTITVV